MRTLLVLFGLFTVGNAIQCPRCTSYDYSKAKGITDEERRNSATKLPGIPECNAPDMQTCADTMRCSTFRIEVSLDIDGRTADIDGVVVKGLDCDLPSTTCSVIEKHWETQLESGVDVDVDECVLQLCDENESCVTTTIGDVQMCDENRGCVTKPGGDLQVCDEIGRCVTRTGGDVQMCDENRGCVTKPGGDLQVCDENGRCVTRTGGVSMVFSPSMVLATTLPLLRLLF